MPIKFFLYTLLLLNYKIFIAQNILIFEDKKDEQDFNDFTKKDIYLNIPPNSLPSDKENTQGMPLADDGSVLLETVNFNTLPKFNNDLDKNYYYWLRKKIFKVYPYYTKAIEQYTQVQDSITKYRKNKQVKKLIEQRQKELADQYENDLKKLTKTEGQIFAKLMNRQTGKTTFEIIKEMKGGWSAFWWDTKAGAVDIDLKKEYNPEMDRQDYFIETILIRSFALDELQPILK